MGFGGFGGNKVSVQIVGDKGRLDKELRGAAKDVDRFGKQSSKSLVTAANLIKTAFAGVAARAVFNFVSGTVSAFSDLNESINAVEVTFGKAADGVLALGENAAESLGLANAEFNTLAVGFAAFVQQIAAEKDGDVVATMDELTTRVADFASVMNIDVTEAADKFRSGLAGETEPLRKFGLDVSAAAVNVRGLELGLGDATGKLSEQEKVLARYSLIMEQTEKTAGDFANTSDDLANAQRILGASFTDLQAELGTRLIPVVAEAVGLMGEWVAIIDAIAKSSDDMGEAGERSIAGKFFDVVGWKSLIGMFSEATRRLGNVVGATDDLTDASTIVLGPLDLTLKAYATGARRAEEYAKRTGILTTATDELGDETDDAADSVDNLTDSMLAAVDPAFNLTKTTADAAEAQTNLNAARDEFGVGSPQFLEAANAAAEATARQNAAQQVFNETFGPQSEETFRVLLAAAGLYGDEIEAIINGLRRAASATRSLPPLPTGGGGSGARTSGPFHTGGRINAPRGQEVLVRALGGETFSNPSHNGGTGGGDIVMVMNGREIGRLIRTELIRQQRQGMRL